jgi:hypothetical protein
MVVVRADAILRLSPLSTATAWAGSSTRTSRASGSTFPARMAAVVSMTMRCGCAAGSSTLVAVGVTPLRRSGFESASKRPPELGGSAVEATRGVGWTPSIGPFHFCLLTR